MGEEVYNGQMGRALYSAIRDGKAIENIPGLVKLIIKEQCWKRLLIESTGEVKEYTNFAEYITTPPPEGLGTDIETLWRLCGNDIEAQTAIDEVTKRGNGGNNNPNGIGGKSHKTIDNVDNIHIDNIPDRPDGTTRQAGIRRLRTQRPDLHTRVLAHEISVHAAMIEAGFRPKTVTIPIDPKRAAKTIKQHFTNDQIQILIDSLVDY